MTTMTYQQRKLNLIEGYNRIISTNLKTLSDNDSLFEFIQLVEDTAVLYRGYDNVILTVRAKTVDADFDEVMAIKTKAERKIEQARKAVAKLVAASIFLDEANARIEEARKTSNLAAYKVASKERSLLTKRANKLPYHQEVAIEIIGNKIVVLVLFGI